jgi:hypothetical protein
MITLKQFLEAGQFRVNNGGQYGWHCYGLDAYMIDLQTGDSFESNSASIIFDQNTQEVYEVSVCDNNNDRAYRLTNVEYADARLAEAIDRAVSNTQAWEGVDYIELETEEDFVEKMTAIMSNQDYNTTISVPVELEDDVLFSLMRMAHEADLTLNKFVEKILREQLGLKNERTN